MNTQKISQIEEFSNQNSSIRLLGYDPASNKVGSMPLAAITSKAAMDAMRLASVSNPYAAVLTVILALGAGIYYLAKAIRDQNKAAYEN